MSEKQKIQFHYIKSSGFRVIHADGAIGGATPTGDIFLSVYSQRGPIPRVTVQEVSERGELGAEIISERVSKEGLVREVEAGIAMRVEVAEQVRDWLTARIDEMKKLREQMEHEHKK